MTVSQLWAGSVATYGAAVVLVASGHSEFAAVDLKVPCIVKHCYTRIVVLRRRRPGIAVVGGVVVPEILLLIVTRVLHVEAYMVNNGGRAAMFFRTCGLYSTTNIEQCLLIANNTLNIRCSATNVLRRCAADSF